VLTVTVRTAGVAFSRGVTDSHCTPPDVKIADPTAPNAMGAPLLVMVSVCCWILVPLLVSMLNTIEVSDPTN